ncbi:MAG TPA: STAS domain-containing protein [Bryobacteraceae bacterium]|nr:STAS domain-containing protein [Bryobacteraceae bacterium]
MHTANLTGEVTATEQNRRLIVRVGAAMTASKAETIYSAVLSIWSEHPDVEAVFLDLSQVLQIDSSGVGVLMELVNRAERAGVPLAICCLQNAPRRLLNKTHLDGPLRVYPTVEEALVDVTPRADPAFRSIHRAESAAYGIRLDEAAFRKPHARHSRRLFWAATAVIVLALMGAGIYSYMAIRAYHGKMHLLTVIQDNLVSTGRRIDATKSALLTPAAQEAGPQTGEPASDTKQRIETLRAQVDQLLAAQQADYSKIVQLQDQVHELQERATPHPPAGPGTNRP